jgi:Flp pilus assembly protein TadG
MAGKVKVGVTTAWDRSGAATVEYAMTVSIWLFWILVSLQLALLVVQYNSVMQVTRDTARWAAIRPDSSDSTIVSHAYSASDGLPGAGASGFSSVVVSPSCPTPVAGRCSNRISGQVLTVSITPNLSSALFVPTSFRVGPLALSLPSTLPAYNVSVMIE